MTFKVPNLIFIVSCVGRFQEFVKFRPCVTCCFYSERLLTPHPAPQLDGHPSPGFRNFINFQLPSKSCSRPLLSDPNNPSCLGEKEFNHSYSGPCARREGIRGGGNINLLMLDLGSTREWSGSRSGRFTSRKQPPERIERGWPPSQSWCLE